MACDMNRRQLLGAASLSAMGLVLGGSLLAQAEPVLATPHPSAAAAPETARPVVRLYMGMPEIDPTGRSAPYTNAACPGRLVPEHSDWWVC